MWFQYSMLAILVFITIPMLTLCFGELIALHWGGSWLDVVRPCMLKIWIERMFWDRNAGHSEEGQRIIDSIKEDFDWKYDCYMAGNKRLNVLIWIANGAYALRDRKDTVDFNCFDRVTIARLTKSYRQSQIFDPSIGF